MAAINKNPRGLISLLGLFDSGATPKDLAVVMSPTIDVTRMYMLNDEVSLSTTFNPIAGNGPQYGGSSPDLDVPQGQVWYVPWIHATGVSGAGGTMTFGVAVQADGVSSYLSPAITLTAAAQTRWSQAIGPFWLKSGDRIGGVVSELVGAANILGVTARVVRFRA